MSVLEPPDNPFWRFSLDRYGRPGAAEICLVLQDMHGADVNLVLFCIWLAEQGWQFEGADQAGEIVGLVREWNEGVISPLRRVRRFLKGSQLKADKYRQELRNQVKRVELESERIEQVMLLDHFVRQAREKSGPVENGPTRRMRASANLVAYFAAIGRDVDEGLKSRLHTLVGLCIDD